MKKLASDIGMSEANLHRCVNNNKIQAADLEKISSVLNVPVSSFFSGDHSVSNVHKIDVGLAIEQRMNELGLSKSEFGRRIGVAQQNVNRILEKGSIDTDKLVLICEVLNHDFFSDFSAGDHSVSLNNAHNNQINGTGAHDNTHVVTADNAVLEERIKSLEALLQEKERLIQVLMGK